MIHQLVQDPNAKPLEPNTPRDYSELSSLVTDSVAIYIDPKPSEYMDNLPSEINEKKFLNIRNPIQKISSLFTKNTNGNGVITNSSQVDQQQASILPSQNVDLYRINILQPKSESAPKVYTYLRYSAILCILGLCWFL